MFKSHKITCFCLILLTLLAFTSQAQGVSVPFVPSDLNPGDEYHVVFMSLDASEATSTDIDDYNAFAQDQGDLDCPGCQTTSWGVNWFAIASTSTVDAKDNIPVTDAPIYLLTDERVADDAADLWDGTIATAILVSQGGTTQQSDPVWTGTALNGVAFPSEELGSSTPRIGLAQGGGLGPAWVSNGPWSDNTDNYAMYVISEVLTVGDPTGTPPVADAGGPYSGTAGQSLGFDGSGSSDADGSIVQYDWDFGDGVGTGSGAAPNYTYAAAGTYTVTLTVTDNDTLTAMATTTATISAEAPDPPQGLVYKLSQPVGAAGGLPDPDPFYVYPTAGTLVTEIVWEDNKQLEAGGPDPLGVFINNGLAYFGVLLDAGLNPIAGTEFRGFGGDADAALIDLPETTRFSGVLLTLGNLDGTSTGFMFAWLGTLTVVEGEAVGNQPPIAKAGGDVKGLTGNAQGFYGANSSDPDGSIVSYRWDFGDNTSSTETNPQHIYSEASTYNVILTVTDDQGATASDTTIATIYAANEPPTANAGGTYDPAYGYRIVTGTVGVPLQFDGSLSSDDNGITRYSWDFSGPNGDGVTPQWTFPNPGNFSVTLEVFDFQGESDVDYVQAIIAEGNQAPVADAGPPVVGTSGVAVQFNGSASSDPEGAGLQYDWDWDDGTQDPDAGPSPQHTYSESGDYTVILTVTDADGISASDTTAASIDPPPIAPQADAGGAYSGTAGVAVAFDGTGSSDPDGSIAQYDWVFGDGTPVAADAGPTPSHTYADSGPYSVTLTVTDNDGLTNSDTTQASIASPANLPPTADPGGPYGGVVGTAVVFDGSGSSDPEGGNLRYDWDYGDGTMGNDAGPTPSHTYTAADSYVVTLTVTDDDGATDSQTTGASMAAANQRPVADANGPYTGTVNAAVAFDGSGSSDPDGTVDQYDWDFGDGTPVAVDAGPTPSHTYTDADIYTVTLTVTDDDGDTSAEAFSTAAIDSSNEPPVADAGGPYVSKVAVPTQFDGSASSDPFGSITRYNWDFGDGTAVAIDAGSTPSHTYAAIGIYDVVLTVTDNQGAFAQGATQAIIGDGINLPPTANPGELYTGEAGVALTFSGSASSDPDGTIVQYDWFFGDGGTATSAKPTHTYAEAGIYTVTLTVADDGGKTDTRKTIAVIGIGNQPPTAEAGGPYAGIINQGIQFYGSDSSDPDGTIAKTVWDFGDGVGTSLFLNPTYTYTTSGPFPVTLTVTDDEGATNTATTLVIVGATLIPPTAEAGGPYIGAAGAPVTFDGTGSDDPDGSITDYDWTFGDGNTGTGPTPDHTYGAGSYYHVTLQVTDDDGLPNADGTTVRIGQFSQPPTAAAGGPYNGRLGAPLTFDGTASDDPDGSVVRYDWDFGDGTTVNDAGPTPDHAYAEDGPYLVTLTVTDDSGEIDTGITVATIGIGNLPPLADAGDSVNGKVRRDITFDGTGSSDRDGNVVSYAWEFGDGNTGTGSNPTHSYADAGKYRVTMTVTDNDGATSSDVTLADVESKSGGGGGGGGGSCFINTLMGH